ncbi:MAG: cytochrome c3 family protein [Woeseiaceae bacterium]|nr:cytochrome c3 family protein [Woeseiaceae bacterium]
MLLGTALATAEEACLECHEDVEVTSTAHPDVACTECHTNVPPEHEDDDLEPLTDDESCNECHGKVQRAVNRSAHKDEAVCGDCHGDPHNIHMVADLDSAVSKVNQIESCGECHDDPPELVSGFKASEHGHALLKSGLVGAAPSCSSCHGDHQILASDKKRSLTSHSKSPEMCGDCHALLLSEWKDGSAHGMAWQDGNEDGPVCVDCHSSHGITDPGSDDNRIASAENCGNCHEDALATFRDSFHGKANKLGFVEGANCADCHTPHRNLGVDDPRSSVHPENVAAMCGSCHENVTANILSFNPHSDPTDPEQDFKVFVVWVFMTALLIGVFIFFGLHDALWLQRTIVGSLRGEFKEAEETSGQYVRRFSASNIHVHLTIVVTFLALAVTGLPLKFYDMAWAQTLINLLGGVETAGIIHRVAAVGTFGYAIYHLSELFVRIFIKRERGMFWGPNSMVPQPQDGKDIWASLKYFLYLGDRPENDRWNYIEKFDYLAVFWGVLIIGMSGLFLWFPMFFTTFLPGWVLNAAYVIHSDEALLATGFIFIFHFFHTHLRPESFPMDIVIFTGKMSLERFRQERPLEYQRLVDNNELDDYFVDPPTARQRRFAYIFGSVALVTGILLAIGIIWALLSH